MPADSASVAYRQAETTTAHSSSTQLTHALLTPTPTPRIHSNLSSMHPHSSASHHTFQSIHLSALHSIISAGNTQQSDRTTEAQSSTTLHDSTNNSGASTATAASSSSHSRPHHPASHSSPLHSICRFPPFGTSVSVGGNMELEWGRQLLPMHESTEAFRGGRLEEWMEDLRRAGYMLLRGVLPVDAVLNARQCVLETLSHVWNKIDLTPINDTRQDEQKEMDHQDDEERKHQNEATFDEEKELRWYGKSLSSIRELFASTPLLRARINVDLSTTSPLASVAPSTSSSSASPSSASPLHRGMLLTGFESVTHDPRVQRLVEGKEIGNIFAQIFGQNEMRRRRRQRRRRQQRMTAGDLDEAGGMAMAGSRVDAAAASSAIAPSIFAVAFPASQPQLSSSSQQFPRDRAPLDLPATFNTKWIRVHGKGEETDEHSDYFRFVHSHSVRPPSADSVMMMSNHRSAAANMNGNGSDNDNDTGDPDPDPDPDATQTNYHEDSDIDDGPPPMYTCWFPLGDYPLEHGTLTVAEGTHRLDGYKEYVRRRLYRHVASFDGEDEQGDGYDEEMKTELPRDYDTWKTGQLSNGSSNRHGGVWRSTHFHPGDIVIFDLRLVHASTRNLTNHFRLSVDTRWKAYRHVTQEERAAFKEVRYETSPPS